MNLAIQTQKLRLIEKLARINDALVLAKFEALLLEAEALENEAVSLNQEQKDTLDTAYQEYLSDPQSARPWEEVKRELFGKYGK